MTARILPFPDFSRPGAVVSEDELAHLEQCLSNPKGPSATILEGQALLLRLRQKQPVVRTARECPKVQELRRRARQWLDRDKSKFSGEA